MVRTVHGRTHEIACTGIYADVVLISILLMYSLSYQSAVRCKHISSKLCKYSHIHNTVCLKYLFIHFLYTLWYFKNIIRFFIRSIRYTDTAWQIDKLNAYTCFILYSYRKLKQFSGKLRIVFICYRIACKECMDTEMLYSFWLHYFKRLYKLLRSHSVLGISRIVHYTVWHGKDSARIISCTHSLW